MTNSFLTLYDSNVKLKECDIEFSTPYFEQDSASKNNIIEEENKVHKYLYFITKELLTATGNNISNLASDLISLKFAMSC